MHVRKATTVILSRRPARIVAMLLALVGVAVPNDASANEIMAAMPAMPYAAPVRQRQPLSRSDSNAVVHAGGTGHSACENGRCESGRCRNSECNQCNHTVSGKGSHCNGQCQTGGCPAHCPVRPESFGFYSTQWRTWPGQAVVQAAHTEVATPFSPPKLEVPGVDEESLLPPVKEDSDATDSDASELDTRDSDARPPNTQEPARPAVEPESSRQSPRQQSRLEPKQPKPDPEEPPAEKKQQQPAEENLFDEASLRVTPESVERVSKRLEFNQKQSVLQWQAVQRQTLREQALRPLSSRQPQAIQPASHVEPEFAASHAPRTNPLR